MKTIVGLYTRKDAATKAVAALECAGFSPASMRVLCSMGAVWQHLGCAPGKVLLAMVAIGTGLGTALSFLLGVAAVGEESLGFGRAKGLGALAIFTLAGGFVGVMLGLFFGLACPEQECRLYIAGISRGGVLLVVRTADEHARRAVDVLQQTDAEGVKICLRSRSVSLRDMRRHGPGPA